MRDFAGSFSIYKTKIGLNTRELEHKQHAWAITCITRVKLCLGAGICFPKHLGFLTLRENCIELLIVAVSLREKILTESFQASKLSSQIWIFISLARRANYASLFCVFAVRKPGQVILFSGQVDIGVLFLQVSRDQSFCCCFIFAEMMHAKFVFVFEQFVMFRFHFGCQFKKVTLISWVRFLWKILINDLSIFKTCNGIGGFCD